MNRQVKNDNHICFLYRIPSRVGTTNEGVLKQYYYDAYGRIRLFSDCLLTVAPLLYQQGPQDSDWARFMPPPQFHGVRHEWHRYQIWGYEVRQKQLALVYPLIYIQLK